MNHTIYECYSKHGYPPWYKKNDNHKSQDKGGQNELGYANACKEEPNTSAKIRTAKQSSINKTLSSFTLKQIQKLLKTMETIENNSQPHNVNQVQRNILGEKSGNLPWILDIGATDHVTYEKILFMTFYKIKPISIKLQNNSLVIAEFAGKVQFSKKIIIFNILYIPEFSLTLYLFKN